MTEQQPAASPDHTQSDRILGPKSWTAIIAVACVLGAALWVVISVLTATPSVDPTVHADMIALTNSQQPDPNAPSRYAEVVEALMNFDAAMDQVANEVVRPEGYYGTGAKILDFQTVRFPADPSEADAARELADAADARRAVDLILERRLFDEVAQVLRSPNLANGYPGAFDESGDLLPMYEWLLEEVASWREFVNISLGCARVLAERGDYHGAASLIEHCDRVPAMFTRQAFGVEHLIGIALASTIATEIEFIATRPDVTRQALEMLRRSHERLSDLGDLSVAIRGEGVVLRDWHYRTHTSWGRYIPSIGEQTILGDGPIQKTELRERFEDVKGYLSARRDASLAEADRLSERYEQAWREEEPTERDRRIEAAYETVYALDDRYELLKSVAPVLGSIIRSRFEVQARITALGIILAMTEHRLDHADWPTSLDQLVPDYLDAIPVNPLTGDPFEYDHEPGQPPSLERFGVGI